MTDIRLLRHHPDAEPYLAIVHGRHLPRRCNETLCQFIARADAFAGWVQSTYAVSIK